MASRLRVSVVLVFCMARSLFAGTNTVLPTTTLAAEIGNNTSAASTFTSQNNGNLGAGNVSKVDTRTLLYAGSNTPIYAHFMGWFGQSNHMNVGYTSSDPTEVNRQVTDALSRGISGFILDWYGPNNSMPNNTAFTLMNEAQSRGGAFHFGIMYDGGALTACHNTSGCDLSQQAISDLTYAYNNFEKSSAYMTGSGRPIVWFFAPDRYGTLNWSLIASSVPGNPLFIFQNSGGFTHANSSGGFSWVIINTSNAYDWSQSYLDNFYLTSFSYPHELTYGTGYKGFNDTLAAWGSNRIMYQQCGQVWMDTLAEIGKYFSTTTQLYAIQLVTWNDYEEGSELETGIDNCVSVTPSVSGNSLSWTVTGSLNTIDHFTVFISSDGQNLMSLGNVPATGTSLDLTAAAMAPGSYTLYVKAVGKPTLSSKMSPAAVYTVTGTTNTALTSSPQPSMYGQSVSFAAAVSPSVATGTVQFFDGSTSLGTATLSGGSASMSISNLSVGPHSITAQYGGDSTFTGSTSAVLTQTVNTSTGMAAFVKADTTTQGNWISSYGADGYNVIGDTAAYPSYAMVMPSGQTSYVWASSTTDIRALQKASSTSNRTAATWYSYSSFTIDVNLTDGNTHQLALYLLDWDNLSRTETIGIAHAATGTVLDSRSVSSFVNGKYLVWNISGHVKITVMLTGGCNAVISGIFFGGPLPATSSAQFVKTDTTTQGNWISSYGADGYNVIGDTTAYPSYAMVTPIGQTSYVWASSTTDIRALQKASNTSDRIEACWYSYSSFMIDLNLTDGNTHQLALYLLDWDNLSRTETISIADAATGTVLDSRNASSFVNGEYVVWNISGHLRITVTRTGGMNAVVSGIFI